MKKWTVLWIPKAQRALAGLWLNAAGRDEVTRAANRIDELLQTNPQDQGESRPEGERILFELPLAVLFDIAEEDAIVYVLHVWQIKPRE